MNHNISSVWGGKSPQCRLLQKDIAYAFALFCFFIIVLAGVADFASAQDGRVGPGDAIVTNFSGVTQRAQGGTDPVINPTGAAALILRIQGAAQVGDNTTNAPIVKVLTAQQIGQVFPIGFAGQGPVYFGATSAFGLQIVRRDPATSNNARLRKGEPGAEWMDGQWGPQGGPGSIWRFDIDSGNAGLFTTLPDGGVAGIGGVAVDPGSGHVYASALDSGLIYHLDPTGAIVEAFDHGEHARPAGGEVPVKDSGGRVSIQDPSFDTLNPSTWGFTAPERQVWGMGVSQGRLFYAVAGPSVWSISVGADGKFGGDPRKEIEVQSDLQARITSIAFDERGALYAAQRGAFAPAPDFTSFAKAGAAQVLRFVRDDGTGQWRKVPQSYPVGRTPDYNNAAGGVALGCPNDGPAPVPGFVNRQLWSTIDGVMPPQNPNLRHGLQGNATPMLRPAFVDTSTAHFAVYDPNEIEASGYMGDIKILPCSGIVPMRSDIQDQFPVVPVCEGPDCVPPPEFPGCFPGDVYLRDGVCCPSRLVQRDGTCRRVGCPPETRLVRTGRCCRIGDIQPDGTCQHCPANSVRSRDGRCCPDRLLRPNGTCIGCPEDYVYSSREARCCPRGTLTPDGRCRPRICWPPLRGTWPNCLCPDGRKPVDGRCFLPPPVICKPGDPNCLRCPDGSRRVDGRCIPLIVCTPPLTGTPPNCHCPEGQRLIEGRCRPVEIEKRCTLPLIGTPPNCRCPNGTALINGRCGQPPKVCPAGETLVNGRCIGQIKACPRGTVGTFPNCRPFVVKFCPRGTVGHPPFCRLVKAQTQDKTSPALKPNVTGGVYRPNTGQKYRPWVQEKSANVR